VYDVKNRAEVHRLFHRERWTKTATAVFHEIACCWVGGQCSWSGFKRTWDFVCRKRENRARAPELPLPLVAD